MVENNETHLPNAIARYPLLRSARTAKKMSVLVNVQNSVTCPVSKTLWLRVQCSDPYRLILSNHAKREKN
jgi:hypothetical protein